MIPSQIVGTPIQSQFTDDDDTSIQSWISDDFPDDAPI